MSEQYNRQFEKLQEWLHEFKELYIEKSTELKIKVEQLITDKHDHEERIKHLESEFVEIRSDTANRNKNHSVMLGIAMIIITIVSVVVGVTIDHYLLK